MDPVVVGALLVVASRLGAENRERGREDLKVSYPNPPERHDGGAVRSQMLDRKSMRVDGPRLRVSSDYGVWMRLCPFE